VQYSSNAYAFRKRSSNNSGLLKLPFLNFRQVGYEAGDRTWWNADLYTKGIFIEEIEQKVIAAPITIQYEASFWAHIQTDLQYAFSEIMFDADNKTILNLGSEQVSKPYVEIDGETVYLPAVLSYTGLDYEPEYNEQDWLEQNNIHSASLNFEVNTFALKTNANITIPTTLVFEFAHKFATADDVNTDDYDVAYEYVINQLTDEVET
jgi:hypothetical protein